MADIKKLAGGHDSYGSNVKALWVVGSKQKLTIYSIDLFLA